MSSTSALRGNVVTASSGTDVLVGTNADGSSVTWLQSNWPFVSWAIFLFGAGWLVASRNDIRAEDPWKKQRWYGWLACVAYCLHQSEEHAYDLRGWRYSFVPTLNLGPLGAMYGELCKEYHLSEDSLGVVSCPLDPKIVLYVNTILIWFGFGGCMVVAQYFGEGRFWFSTYLNWGMAVVNGLGGHIAPALLTSSYNPGVVQSLVMVPFGIWIILGSGRPILCLLNGIVSHAMLAIGVNIVFRLQTDEAVTMFALMMFVALPVPLGLSSLVYSWEQANKASKTK